MRRKWNARVKEGKNCRPDIKDYDIFIPRVKWGLFSLRFNQSYRAAVLKFYSTKQMKWRRQSNKQTNKWNMGFVNSSNKNEWQYIFNEYDLVIKHEIDTKTEIHINHMCYRKRIKSSSQVKSNWIESMNMHCVSHGASSTCCVHKQRGTQSDPTER